MTYIANFPNVGYIGHEFSNAELKPIRNEVETIQENFDTHIKINHSFTSTVKKEYKLVESVNALEALVLPFVPTFHEFFDTNKPKKSYYLETAWVNFQEAGEFFAPHTHSGDFSFALYLQVPFTIEEEHEYLSSIDKHTTTASGFNFFYTDALGEIKPSYLPVDKTWENKIIIFPGKMLHSVQPFFTSTEFRITISGNIRTKDD